MQSTNLIEEIFSELHEITDSEIIALINSLKQELALYDYIEKIATIDYSKKFEGRYLPSEKSLVISPHRIYENFYKWANTNNYPMNARAITRLYNLFVLITIYHETFHVLQDKKDREDRKDDSLGIMLHETIEFGRRIPNSISLYEKIIYKRFYKYMLMERNAESESLYKILCLDEQIDFLNDRERRVIINQMLNVLTGGYINGTNISICPAQLYYLIRVKGREFKRINFLENYDNFTKLSWGMPINNKILVDLFLNINSPEEIKKLLKSR